MFSVHNKGGRLNFFIDIQHELFDCAIISIILHGFEVWGYGNIGSIKTVHLRLYKHLLGVKTSTTNCMICEIYDMWYMENCEDIHST